MEGNRGEFNYHLCFPNGSNVRMHPGGSYLGPRLDAPVLNAPVKAFLELSAPGQDHGLREWLLDIIPGRLRALLHISPIVTLAQVEHMKGPKDVTEANAAVRAEIRRIQEELGIQCHHAIYAQGMLGGSYIDVIADSKSTADEKVRELRRRINAILAPLGKEMELRITRWDRPQEDVN